MTSPAAKIDEIDHRLIQLLLERNRLVRESFRDSSVGDVAGLMSAQSLQVDAVVDAALRDTDAEKDTVCREVIGGWLRHAASIGLAGLHRFRIAFLGPEYSYSHLATVKLFGEAAPTAAVATIPAVFESIVRGDAQAGVVPIENSTDGRIVDTLGMFVKVNVKICGEVLLPIHHNLLSRTPREQIREVHSKPQALSQCRTWLANHLPKAKLVECSSTTAAAELAAATPGAAAIAALEAGRRYGLDVIDASIEDNPNNVTRFAVLGRTCPGPSGNDKTSLLFQLRHRPGALADAMVVFKNAGLNLTWIESFPAPQTAAEYIFFVESAGHAEEPRVAEAIENLRPMTLRLEVLGTYPKAAPVARA